MSKKTYSQLLEQCNTIKDETQAGANTAERVGTALVDIVDSLSSFKPLLFFENKKRYLIASCSGVPLDNVALQVVYYNRRAKEWRAASGVGVKNVYPYQNEEQVGVSGVTDIRCKKVLTNDSTMFDLAVEGTVTTLFNELFIPFKNLKQYSFTDSIVDNSDNGPTKRLYKLINRNMKTPISESRWSRYCILKTGLAITKSFVTRDSNVKTVIISNIVRFNMFINSDEDELRVSFKSKMLTRGV